MKTYIQKLTVFIFIASSSMTSFNVNAHSLDLDLNLNEQSALTSMTDSDWLILKSKARDVLKNSFDGDNHVWQNKQTGNSGVIKVLSTSTDHGSLCRNTQFKNTVNNLTSTTTVNLCKEEDGKWAEASPRVTTTDNAAVIDSSANKSDMFSAMEDLPSSGITQKTLTQTSEFCRNLAQDIERLKGKPIRRNAAVQQHKAECQRITQ